MNRKTYRQRLTGLAALAAAVMLAGCAAAPAAETTAPALPTETAPAAAQTTAPAEQPAQPAAQQLSLPYLMTEAGLEIQECFASSIPNPDGGDLLAENVASLQIVNKSDRYLENVFLTLKASDDSDDSDGGMYRFQIRDLPAGGVAWVFDLDSRPWTEGAAITELSCDQLQFGRQQLPETLLIQEEDLLVTLTNTGTEPLEALQVVCRCDFGEVYFGGVSYDYPVERLESGEKIVISAEQCYMGTAKVVNIRQAAQR